MSELLNFPMKKVKEGSVELFVPAENKISKKLPVFYNPVMKHNRDITIILLKQFPPMSLCDPLAGTGVRSLRFAKELDYKSIVVNDMNERAFHLIKKNMQHNNVDFELHCEDANLTLLKSKGFDFIELDVFGSPNFMLDSAVRRISRNSVLAVTATDTSALCGSYPNACKRKYWANPLRNYLMHEFGLRILIRKCQLVAGQYEKAIIPIFSYSKDHYMRVFLRVQKTKTQTNEILKQHKKVFDAGPIWTGQLWDADLAEKMHAFAVKNKEKHRFDDKLLKFLNTIKNESKIDSVFFHDIHALAKQKKIKLVKMEDTLSKLKEKGIAASRTIFSEYGIRADVDEKEFIQLIK